LPGNDVSWKARSWAGEAPAPTAFSPNGSVFSQLRLSGVEARVLTRRVPSLRLGTAAPTRGKTWAHAQIQVGLAAYNLKAFPIPGSIPEQYFDLFGNFGPAIP